MGTQWHVAGLADFNGDGATDILWRNDNGAVAVWSSNGATFLGTTYTSTAAASWSIAGTGDYNGDGKADILWHNSDGTISI